MVASSEEEMNKAIHAKERAEGRLVVARDAETKASLEDHEATEMRKKAEANLRDANEVRVSTTEEMNTAMHHRSVAESEASEMHAKMTKW